MNTTGKVWTTQIGPKKWKATANHRDPDGKDRQYERSGPTATAATNTLLKYLSTKTVDLGGEINRTTTMNELAEVYFGRLDQLVAAGDRSPGTQRLYRGCWDNHVRPAVGWLRLAEVDIQCVDQLLIRLRRSHGADLVRTCRAVLSGMLGIAARYKAVPGNPVRDASPIPGGRTKRVRSLEPGEAVDLWEKLMVLAATPAERASPRRYYRSTVVHPDLPDLVLWMLGTSERIGQAVAVHWPWIDLENATAALGPNVIRVKGAGLELHYGTTKTRERVLDLPEQVMTMLLLRHAKTTNRAGPVFPDAFGGLRDPHNTSGDLRRALDRAGYQWVTSHVFRKTVATVLDDAGLSARQVADQLAHARPSMTQDRYMARKARNPRAKAAIEAMLATEPARTVVPLDQPG